MYVSLIKIRTLLNFAFEVVKMTVHGEETNYVDEFYREFNYNEKEALIKSSFRTIVADDLGKKKNAGEDFNAFILQQREVTKERAAVREASEFIIRQLQLMHRISLLRLRLHGIIMHALTEPKTL